MLARKKVLGNYNVGKTVGQGAFSKVKLGVHKETGQKVAIKIIDKKLMAQKAAKAKKAEEDRRKKKEAEEYAKRTKEATKADPPTTASTPTERVSKSRSSTENKVTSNVDPKGDGEETNPIKTGIAPDAPSFVASLQLEVQLMMRLDHPNIINLYSIMETEDECFVVMEYAAGGELIEYIAARNYLSEREARKFFRQIISAMDHCHLASVVHRDLKLENLLLNDKRDILISDFGLGRTYNPDVQEYLKTFCGTPNYAAVELISGIPYNGIKSDIWAMGVALYVMMTGKTPFSGSSISQLYSKIKAVDYKCPDYFSGDLKHLLTKMLKKDPVKRADMETLRQDAWVNFEEIERPLRLLPKVTGIASPAQITQFISSITKTSDYTLYTIRQHTREGMSMEGAGEDKNKSVQARRRSISAQNGNAGSLAPLSLGRPRANSRRFSNVGAVITENNTRETEIDGDYDSLSPLYASSRARVNSYGNVKDPRRMSFQDGGLPKVPPLPGKEAPFKEEDVELKQSQSFDAADETRVRRNTINFGVFGRGRKSTKSVGGSSSRSSSQDEYSGQGNSVVVFRNSSLKPPPIPNITTNEDRELAVLKRMAMVSPDVSPSRGVLENSQAFSQVATSFSGKSSAILSDPTISRSSSVFSPTESTISPFGTNTGSLLTDQEIENWHEFNRPPKEIRSARYSFNPKTTSTLSPSYIFQDVHRVLVSMQKFLADSKLQFVRNPDLYLIQCRLTSNSMEEVEFDVEVCKVWLLNLHGVRIKKQGGSALKFKEAYTLIVDMLEIN